MTAANYIPMGQEMPTIMMPSAAGVVLPEFYGYGAVTRGALDAPGGATTVHVTNLNSTGAGSLRAAVSASNRYVVFDVGGTMTLLTTIDMTGLSFITIDGFTAPSPGFTIDMPEGPPHNSINIENSNDIVVRGLRCRWHSEGFHAGSGDIFAISGSSRVICDRNTCIASADGIFDLFGVCEDISITRNLMAHTVNCCNMNTGANRNRVTYANNLYTHNGDRQPCRVSWTSLDVDVVENIVYGWAWTEAIDGSFLLRGDNGVNPARVNFEDNTLIYVSPHGTEQQAIFSDLGSTGGPHDPVRTFLANNILPAGETYVPTESVRFTVPEQFQVPRLWPTLGRSRVLDICGAPFKAQEDLDMIEEVRADMP